MSFPSGAWQGFAFPGFLGSRSSKCRGRGRGEGGERGLRLELNASRYIEIEGDAISVNSYGINPRLLSLDRRDS